MSASAPAAPPPPVVPVTSPVSGMLDAFFAPAVIAVVGANRRRGEVGSELFHNLTAAGFRGRVFAVNPNAAAIEGAAAWPSVAAIPTIVDLAVIAVPCAAVEAAVDDCLKAGVRSIVIISAGFGETGEAGRQREAAIRDKIRLAGARVVGPNCMGLLNTDPAVRMNATFAAAFPPTGPIAFSTQSGALGLAVLEWARQFGVGISNFASIGNKADVSTSDLLEFWQDDSRTSVILLYVESFGDARRFRQVARRVSRRKPIVAVKSGRSQTGARAASSHTGALAVSDRTVGALFRDAGVIRTDTVEEMFQVGTLLAHQPLPRGRRVAVLTNGGGPGILAADACEAHGLSLAGLSQATVTALRAFLPAAASVSNPIDMLATASTEDYRQALGLIVNDDGVDSVVTIFTPALGTRADDVARTIAETTRDCCKTVLAVFFGAAGVTPAAAPVPCYAFPESAVAALSQAVGYAKWRAQAADTVPVFTDLDITRARGIVAAARPSGGGWLDPVNAFRLLECCGIPSAGVRTVVTVDGAFAAARQAGYPVVLKGVGPELLHKTESQAVLTNLSSEEAVARAFHALIRRPDVTHVLVQPHIRDGVEMFVGAISDPEFGGLIMAGSGGTLVELLRDAACRLTPLTESAATEMLNEVRGAARLRGYRGTPPLDEPTYRTMLLRVSTLLEGCPEIQEIDLNPVIVTPTSAVAVDVRIRVR